MALHTKWDRLLSLRPDVAVIPECAAPDVIWKRRGRVEPCSHAWIGDNRNKGLGIFCFGGHEASVDGCFEPSFKHFLPVNISGPRPLRLLGVWAFNHRAISGGAPVEAPTRKALAHYAQFLGRHEAVVAGDFNHSVRWDRPGWAGNFENIALALEDIGLRSAYHVATSAAFGAEKSQTHFFRKGPIEYHIDYCFTSARHAPAKMAIGSRAEWIEHSDHAPITVEW